VIRYVVTCEHATAHVPKAYRAAFTDADEALKSHRGSDIGALELAQQLAQELQVTCLDAGATRLLADTNRSRHHRSVFSEWSLRLTPPEREQVLANYWQPHRDRVQGEIEAHIRHGRAVVHVGVHSFTPCFDGEVREIDVAWLYDPSRKLETQRVAGWRNALAARQPHLRLRRNAPYRGTSDGLTTYLRTQFPADQYLGIELEISQSFPLGPAPTWRSLQDGICAAFRLSRG